MSYADLLSQYANKMNDVRYHAEEVSQSIAGTKAAAAKEMYDRAREHLALASEVGAAASGAYMSGRKVYKKIREKLTGEKEEPEAEGPEAEGAEGAQGASDAGRAVGQATSNGAGSGASGGAADEVEDTIQDNIQYIKPKPLDDYDPIDQLKGPVRIVSRGPPEPQGDLARNVATADEYGETGTKAEQAGKVAEPEEVSAEGPTLEGAPAEAIEATAGETAGDTNSIIQSARVGGRVLGNVAKSAIKSGLKSAGEGLGEEAAEGIGEGLASQALDFLGPVGLGIGAITGLVDLFEGIYGKKPTPAGQEKTPLETEGGGLDVKGLTDSDAPATATLV